MTDISDEYFINRQVAHDWLLENDFKISIGKFYQDIKKKGFPVLNKDKTVSKYQVAIYGKNLDEDRASDPSALLSAEYTHKKEKAESQMAEMKAKRMAREEDKLWLHADDAWSTTAAILGSLRDSIRYHLNKKSTDIIEIAGGDLSRSAEVYESLEACVDDAFNEIASSSIDVTWEGGVTESDVISESDA